MVEADRARWNERYRVDAYDFSPLDWLVALGPKLRPARAGTKAFDLACGGGRNSLFLARLGYQVDAWDISDVALEILQAELGRLTEPLDVRPRRVDLEAIELPRGEYDLVLDAHYLDRALLPALVSALRPGGLLLVHTFLQVPGGAYNPAHALEPGELRRVLAELTELEAGEDVSGGVAYFLGRRG
jgi:SAM-dependent methyltransferase